MRQISSYDELPPLLAAQWKRGVLTNALLTPGDYRREIAAGTLWVHAWDGGLLLLRRRDGSWRMNFYLTNPDLPAELPAEGPVVTEIAFRPKDAGLQKTVGFWQENGFTLLFRRERLVFPEDYPIPPGPFPVRAAGLKDSDAVQTILTDCFDPLTGCLPTPGQLRQALEAGHILIAAAPEGPPAGLLHIQPEKRGTQLRHLAVTAPYRRKGAAQSLLSAYRGQAHGPGTVWVRTDNEAAEHTYRKNGCTPDGWMSAVLCRP